jgi:uroporphyrinogen-III synthase
VHGDADVLALLPRIAQDIAAQSDLLYLASDETRVDVAALLAAADLRVHSHIAYHARAESKLTADLRSALTNGQLAAVTLFSPHTASLVAALLQQHGLAEKARDIHAYCLSLPVAEAAGTLPWASIHACHRPTRSAMVDLIVSQLRKT